MSRISTTFLQIVLVLIGVGVLALMLWEPHLEGRNVDATLFQIYFNDPFLAYAYLGSIPFFIGLYQAFNILRYVRQHTAFSTATVTAWRNIKYCALATAGFILGADAFLMIAARSGEDDPAGAVALGIVAIFASIIIAAIAAVFEQIFQNAQQT